MALPERRAGVGVTAEVTFTMLGATTDKPHSVRFLGPRVTDVRVRPLLLGLLGLVLTPALLVSACTGTPPKAPSATAPTELTLSWQEVQLPQDLSAVTLATDGSTVFVGAYGPTRPHPHLLSLAPSGAVNEVPLTPRSPYAFEGRWTQVVTRDGAIDAIAGARGGAHGNYRWTTWSGTDTGVSEQEQPFGVFGSYGAGDLAGIAYAGRSPVVLGAWQSDRTGLDVAVWTRSADRWARQPSTGTPLGSTPEELVSATSIASRGDGVALAGSVTHLSSGSVRVEPAIWTSADEDGPWTRVDLTYKAPPDRDAPVEAQGLTCSPDLCLVSGTAGGRFTLWEVGKDTVSQRAGIPDVVVTENAEVLAPVVIGDDVLFVVPSGTGSTILRRTGETWSVGVGPDGTPVSAVVVGDALWVVSTHAKGTGSLARAGIR